MEESTPQIPHNSKLETGRDKISQHFPEDSHAPKKVAEPVPEAGRQELSTIHLPGEKAGDALKTKDMEVHHHPHHLTHKKKWSGYLMEFLMLFLAVFLGFLAENQREHYVEHQREKKYAAQLVDDLKKDTMICNTMVKYMSQTTRFYDSARSIFQQYPSLPDEQFVRLARYSYASYNLDNIATTFNQMKNSGSLRYIKNAALSAALSDYYDGRVPRLMTFFEYINEKLHTQIEPFFAEHFDLNVTPLYYPHDSLPVNLKYYNRSEGSDLLIKNYFQLYFNGVSYIISGVKDAGNKSTELIVLLQKEYHLE